MRHHKFTRTTRIQYWAILLLRVVLFVMIWMITSGIILALFPPDDDKIVNNNGLAVGMQVGVQVHHSRDFDAAIQRGYFDDVQGMGLQWTKQTIRWADVEPEQGAYDWSVLDFVLPIARDSGLKVLVSVSAAPDWARPAGVDLSYDGPPANMEDFSNFLSIMLERYPQMIHAIEVWPLPNVIHFWDTPEGISAEHYMKLLRTANHAIKGTNPNIIVVSGALIVSGGYEDRAINDIVYIEKLIENGLLDHSDCIGARHLGYNFGPNIPWDSVPEDIGTYYRYPFENPHPAWSFRSTLEFYANRIAVAGGDQQLCVTRFGWGSAEDLGSTPFGYEFALDNSLDEQARWLVEALNNMETWEFVQMAIIYNLNFGLEGGLRDIDLVASLYSLITPKNERRPAVNLIREWNDSRRD